MDTKTKILIGVVVLLVVLFICGTGIGAAGNGSSTQFDLDDPLGSFGNMFGQPARVSIDDLQSPNPASCLSASQPRRMVINVGQTCQYTIGSVSSGPTRRVQPQIPGGTFISLELDQPFNQNPLLPDEQVSQLPGGSADHVDVYKEGGTLKVRCINSSIPPCRITLGQ